MNLGEVGKNLHEMSSQIIPTPTMPVVRRWFHSNKDVDIYMWVDSQQQVIKQQVLLYGQVVEWNIVDGLRTGFLYVDEVEQSQNIAYDELPQSQSIFQALELIKSSEVVEEVKKVWVDNFHKGRSISQLRDEELMEKFGAVQKKSGSPVSYLKSSRPKSFRIFNLLGTHSSQFINQKIFLFFRKILRFLRIKPH